LAASQVRGWTLRQVTGLAAAVQRVPYPIPPAGADPLTWHSEEEPPPLGVTARLPADVALLQVGPRRGLTRRG
jgi:cancer susceptibility candidate protein 1